LNVNQIINETTNTTTLLQQAQVALENGDHRTAQRLLARTLRDNPRDETAWLWMALTLDSPQRRRECLQRVLEINPNNTIAHQNLAQLETDDAALAATPRASSPHIPVTDRPLEAQEPAGEPMPLTPDPAQHSVDGQQAHSEANEPSTGILLCEKCQRPLGAELINCSDRTQDECPYQIIHQSAYRHSTAGWMLIAIGLATALAGLLLTSQSLLLSPLGLLLAGLGAYVALGQRLILHNPATGQMWEQITLLGVQLTQNATSPLQPVPNWIPSPPVLTYPASVSALYRYNDQKSRSQNDWIGYAADVIYRTLLSLLSQDVIQLWHTSIVKSDDESDSEPLLAFCPANPTSISGELEQRITRAVDEWSRRLEPSLRFDGTLYTRRLRHCLCLHDLMIVIFEGEKPNPGEWLVSSIVSVDADRRGIGQAKGRWLVKYEISPQHQERLLKDYAATQTLKQHFAAAQPALALQLRQEIQQAIESRIAET
jgi:hypothetical protein